MNEVCMLHINFKVFKDWDGPNIFDYCKSSKESCLQELMVFELFLTVNSLYLQSLKKHV